ncbi:MAG TPA: adenylate/guanylate cyclase domain-containing protein [Burkholderiales bacterium]|nr:adenylate/guanylate cyclase domain-containing protein [Burkholderiales bacterium]
MSSERAVQRRLAAILSADAAGYSRLMGEDDAATVRLLTTCRQTVTRLVEARSGRVVDAPGDNLLAEFGSAVDAVAAAVEIQHQLDACNAGLPEARRMQFRIGVNLGDVIVEDGRLYGDGVNVAARVEKLASPGGVCVSGKVYDEVRSKLKLRFEDLGEQELHNIAGGVRVYRVASAGGQAAKAAAPAPAAADLQAKPAIIVLPFTNMSGAAEQEFFVDGLTEDVLTDLSRFKDLFVISRNTSFKFKGQAVDVKKAAKDLGVQYVVEGSVRRAGNRVRITVQLIEAEADRHLWAERYDRDLEDIFALQDEITRSIVAVLPGRVQAAARDRAERKPPASMAAYECLLEAKVLHHRSNRPDNARAFELAERAIELDPKYAHAHAWKACILGQQWGYGWCRDRAAAELTIETALGTALALDENDSDVQRVLAAMYLLRNDHDKAVSHQQRALRLNPNDDLIVVQQGEVFTWLGQPEEGIPWIQQAMRLNPFHPPRFWGHLGRAYFVARRYGEAIEAFQRISAPDQFIHCFLAACYAQLGDAAAAARHAAAVKRLDPEFTWGATLAPTLHYRRGSDLAHHRDAVLKAGLPA